MIRNGNSSNSHANSRQTQYKPLQHFPCQSSTVPSRLPFDPPPFAQGGRGSIVLYPLTRKPKIENRNSNTLANANIRVVTDRYYCVTYLIDLFVRVVDL